MSIDLWMGCVWTLLAILTGVLITLVLVAVMGDRGDPGPDDDPEPEPTYPYTDEEMDRWIREHTTTDPFEANLLRGGVATDRTAR